MIFRQKSIYLLMAYTLLAAQIRAGELLKETSFEGSSIPWSVYSDSPDYASGEHLDGHYAVHVNSPGTERWHIQFRHQGLTLQQGHTYKVSFTVQSTKDASVYCKIGQASGTYQEFWNNNWTPFTLSAGEPLIVEQSFTMKDVTQGGIEFAFHLGSDLASKAPYDVFFDNIHLEDPQLVGELLDNTSFDDDISVPWQIYTSSEGIATGAANGGEFALTVNDPAVNRWDIQFRHQGLTLDSGHTYTVTFALRADKETAVYAKIGQSGAPYQEFWNNKWTPFALKAGEVLLVKDSFTVDTSLGGIELAFHLGADLVGAVPSVVYFDNISLTDPGYIRPSQQEMPKPDIRINQLGYGRRCSKRATVINESSSPIPFCLKDSAGTVLFSGMTTVFGFDTASGDFVHRADFSRFSAEGQNYTLNITIDSEERISHPFAIADDIYNDMKYDALAYFYHNRSGIAIEMPYACSEKYTRPAGHNPDTMRTWPGTGQEDYVLDVSKGWYDAGDHGKYVVNGGISVWTIMNEYERTLYISGANRHAFDDGTMNIPENNNGVPDILDEARWEVEMLLAMQVPEGLPYAGMVHHKGHDEVWTGIPTAPHNDNLIRYLAPVSTAATLNLAAVAAQSARLWKYYDRKFSARCLIAAARAWNAALKNPSILNPDISTGGGLYNDSNLKDEFYWAACELFTTTGNNCYKKNIQQSPFYLQMSAKLTNFGESGVPGVFTWDNVQGLGTITLALVPNNFNWTVSLQARNNIVAAAVKLHYNKEKEGYLTPLSLADYGYPWGSNSFVANMLIVSALAYDFSNNKMFLNDVSEGMDYLLGRNAMDKSYVSGYGERALTNPHHRFWAHQANSDYPIVPPGVLSGGPNSGLEDDFARSVLDPENTPAQKCYIDNIESWSTNEITINWNAPLAWVTAFLDDRINGSNHYHYKCYRNFHFRKWYTWCWWRR